MLIMTLVSILQTYERGGKISINKVLYVSKSIYIRIDQTSPCIHEILYIVETICISI